MRNLPTPESAGGDSRSTLPPLPGCGQPAVAHFELYNSPAFKSLDGSLWLCQEHAPITAAAAATFDAETGLTSFWTTQRDPAGKRCGDGFDYLAKRAMHAPAEIVGEALAALGDLGVETYDQAVTALITWERRRLLSTDDRDAILDRFPQSAPEPDRQPDEDAALRALYPKGHHPVLDVAERAVRAAADLHGPHLTRQGAEALLAGTERWILTSLTDRERAGLLARFTRDSLCGTCSGPIEFVPRPATAGAAWGPPYYRHTRPGAAGHVARPAVTR